MKQPIRPFIQLLLFSCCLFSPTADAADLLVLANHEAIQKTSATAVVEQYEHLKLDPNQFELVMVTYQYLPTKTMNQELIEVVIDYQIPIKEETEKIGKVIKVVVTKRRFVVTAGIKGYIKQIVDKTIKSYKVDDVIEVENP